jgi:S-disulfanyl-L-cysteine oxidoreductase SoxD
MFSLRRDALFRGLLLAICLWPLQASAQGLAPWSGLGRPATVNEIKAWDIDVRPDFKGLPPGSGTVAAGEQVWETQCASCHGTFGESSEIFTPLVGGTTKDDMNSGTVANLKRPDYPQRTSLMKLSTLSTLWDYINRAMPWNAPKSLSVSEVYAVTAYILHLGDVLPADFVLSNQNMAKVQAMLPNRRGMVMSEGLWRLGAKPDVQGSACMKDCKSYELKSQMPDYAKSAHGNLAEQSRAIGGLRGVQTLAQAAEVTKSLPPGIDTGRAAAQKANCFTCHATDTKLLGPSFKEVAVKYRADANAAALLAGKVKNGGQGSWGSIPMPAHPNLADPDLQLMISWIFTL